jgi:uncharacterized protein (DUF1330 family)
MPVYLVAEIEIKDLEMYSRYVEKVPEVIERFGGRYLSQGGRVTPMSGNWNPERMILIEFQTLEQLQQCFNSAEYLEVAPFRTQSTVSRSIIVEGLIPA